MAFMPLLAKNLPQGENATSHTGLFWPSKVDTHTAEPSGSTRHSLIRQSLLHVAASEASQQNAIEVAGSVWPVWIAVLTASGRISRASSAPAMRLLNARRAMQ